MSFRSSSGATAVTTALGWFGLGVFAFVAIWNLTKEDLTWWVKIAAGTAGGLAFVGYGVEALSQELTVRRWAISQFVFTTVTIVLVVAAILDSNVLGLSRTFMVIFAI